MTQSVEAFGGTVSQLLGDGLLALFGAPVAQEDHALRACLAARAMQRAARARSADPRRPPTSIRIGIHSGEVMVGVSGERSWAHYRADGSTIHIASRLERIASPGATVIGATTHRLVAEHLHTRPLGLHAVRGLGESIALHELLAEDDRSAAAPLARRRRWGPLVGRDAIRRRLREAAECARDGSCRVVGLRGEAGIGKSRLLAECSGELVDQGFQACVVQVYGYSSDHAYGLVADICRSLLGIDPGQTRGAEAHAAARAAVRALASTPRVHAAALSELLELGPLDPDWLALGAARRREFAIEAVHRLVTRRLDAGPLLLAIEDVFLADRQSIRMLEALVPRLRQQPVLLCLTYRPEFEHRWQGSRRFTEIAVPPLPPQAMGSLAQAMLGRHPSVQAAIRATVDRAEGNPFFLEQLAITLIDDGVLVGAPGDYRLARPTLALPPPASIAASVSARVDRLPPPSKSALEAAAILSEATTPALIATMLGTTTEEAAERLRRCADSGLLVAPQMARRHGDGAEPEGFRFRHALIRDVVDGTLTRERRAAWHRGALAALQTHAHPGDTRWAHAMTHHAVHGGQWAEAAGHAVRAMATAVARSANRDAMTLFDMGIGAARQVGAPGRALSLELALRLEASGALMALGQTDRIFDNLQHARAIAVRIDDRRRQASVLLQLSVLEWIRGRYLHGLAFATEALEAGRLAERRHLQMAAGQSRVMMLHALGRYRPSAEEAAAVLDEYRSELDQTRLMPGWATSPIINLCSFHGSSLWRLGDYLGAQERLDTAYRLLREFDHPYSRGLIDFVQGQIWIELGRYDEARDLMQRSVASCVSNDVPAMMACCVAMLGGATARGGRPDDAIAMLSDVMHQEHHWRIASPYGQTFVLLNLGVALRLASRLDEAIHHGRKAVEIADTAQQAGHCVEALLELAESCEQAGRRVEAQDARIRALAHARTCEMPVLTRRLERLLRRATESESEPGAGAGAGDFR